MPRRAPRPTPPTADDAQYRDAIEAELLAVARRVGLLGAATPRDAHVERARLLDDFANGRERLPSWTYEPTHGSHTHLLRTLDGVAERLRPLEATPLGPLYLERVRELGVEIQAARAVGTSAFAELAACRFARGPERARADAVAAEWAREPDAAPPSSRVPSDDRDPRSLVSRLRAEISRRRLPFAVRTSPALSALAAISGDTIWVAEGRRLGLGDVERTVAHEIEAHAMPRATARTLRLALFAIGTAGGTDDQEGYALWLEEVRGLSGPGRRRELGARHEAVSRMRRGADFVAVVRGLREAGVELDAALRIAERAFRGSHGRTPGLGREHVYLEALVRVRERLEAEPEDEAVLAAGQVSVRAIDVLRPWAVPAHG